jgi:multicomponent Na+:H+ antiporter subunit E
MIRKLKLTLKLLFIYTPYLLLEILKSGINTCSVILFSKEPKQSDLNLIKINTNIDEKIKKVLYACSITLTPGTFTIDIKDNSLLVNALNCNSEKDKFEAVASLEQMENKIKSI